jgi:hypothetical protein
VMSSSTLRALAPRAADASVTLVPLKRIDREYGVLHT